MELNIGKIEVVLLMVFLTYRIIMLVVVVSLISYNSFDFEIFLFNFNLSISDNFTNDMLMCSPQDDTETTHENSDDESKTSPGGSDDESEPLASDDPRNSPLIIEVSIAKDVRLHDWFEHSEHSKDWYEQGDRYVRRYSSEDVTITTDSTKYYPNQTVEVLNNDDNQTEFCSKVTVTKPCNANIEVTGGESHISETDSDAVLFRASITGNTAITEEGGNTQVFQAPRMSIDCDKTSCDISDRDVQRGKSFEFNSL